MSKISIIIPVYNSAHLIEQTLESVLRQTYRHWEIIIVDDGSKDNIVEVVNRYLQEDERIQFFQQSNGGASAARNTGIKKARYDWILFLDADDWIREDYFEKMIPLLETDGSIDVAHCGWTRVGKDGKAAKENFGGEEEDMFPLLAQYCPFAIHSCIARKSLVQEVGGFDTSFKTCGDWDFWQRIARSGAKFKMVKEVMAFYRSSSGSLSSDGNQFCKNGLQVISQAYRADPRVSKPKHDYANGLNADDLASRKYYFITWSAGLLIGEGKSAVHLLEHVNGNVASGLNGKLIGETLLDSINIPAQKNNSDFYSHWLHIENNLKGFLDRLEVQSGSNGVSEEANAFIERFFIEKCFESMSQVQIGNSFALKVDVEEPIADVSLPANTKRFFGFIYLQKNLLGFVELQAVEESISAELIKDAIATKFSWQILGQFFWFTIYNSQEQVHDTITSELHDRTGWKVFLQELWQRRDWTEEMFYEPLAVKNEKAEAIKVDDHVEIEISETIPAVKTRSSALSIKYYVGGVYVGTVSLNVQSRIVSPQMIRAAINLHSKYESCRIVVREALIGQKLNQNMTLIDRLRAKKKEIY